MASGPVSSPASCAPSPRLRLLDPMHQVSGAGSIRPWCHWWQQAQGELAGLALGASCLELGQSGQWERTASWFSEGVFASLGKLCVCVCVCRGGGGEENGLQCCLGWYFLISAKENL